jgi:hypothetical protein
MKSALRAETRLERTAIPKKMPRNPWGAGRGLRGRDSGG